MTSTSEVAKILEAAITGIPEVAQMIAFTFPQNRARAFDAAERSYLQTARELGCAEGAAQDWVSAVMVRLRAEVDEKARSAPRWWTRKQAVR